MFAGTSDLGVRLGLKLASRLTHTTFQASAIHGALFQGKITLQNFSISRAKQSFGGKVFDAHFNPWALLKAQWNLDHIQIQNARWIRPIGNTKTLHGPSVGLGSLTGGAHLSLINQRLDLRWRSSKANYSGDIHTNGRPSNYQIHGTLYHKKNKLFILTGSGNRSHLQLESNPLKNRQHAAYAKASFNLHWSHRGDIKAQFNISKIHMANVIDQGDGHLDLSLVANYHPDRWTLTLKKLDGYWLDKPIHLKGKLSNINNTLKNIELEGMLGEATNIDINLHQNKALWVGKAKLNLPDLTFIYPTIAGALKLNFAAQKSHENQSYSVNAKAENLAWGLNEVQSLSTQIHFTHSADSPFTFAVKSKGLQLTQAPQLSALNIQTSGLNADHTISIAAQLGDNPLDAVLSGHFSGTIWRGTLTKLNYISPMYPWQLQSPARFKLSRRTLSLTPLCLAFKAHHFCVSGHYVPKKNWAFKLDFNAVPMLALSPALPDIPYLDIHAGILDGQFHVAGNTQAIQSASGKITLKNGGVSFPDLASNMQDINATLSAKDDHLEAIMHGRVGSGLIEATATTPLNMQKQPMLLTLQGKNLRISNTKSFMLYASPKLKATMNQGIFNISGEIDIPKARILSLKTQDIVSLPDDVQLIHPDIKNDQHSSNTGNLNHLHLDSLNYQLKLNLKPDVFADIKGLEGNFMGELSLKGNTEETHTNGTLTVKNGHYYAFGQKLKVKQSTLVFSDDPINNPHINMQAVRAFGDMQAAHFSTNDTKTLEVGIHVTGKIQAYKVSLYSEPAGLSSKNILSLMLFGERSEKLASDNSNLLLSALSSLNFSNREHALNAIAQIQSSLGLDEISLETGQPQNSVNTGASHSMFTIPDLPTSLLPNITGQNVSPTGMGQNNARLVLGKALSKNLYIRYNMGVGSGLQNTASPDTISVYYTINKYLQLQTISSGQSNALNLMYIIEHN